MTDSYIVELKYCKSNTSDSQVQQLFRDAAAQVSRYAESNMVKELVKTTILHKLVVVNEGWIWCYVRSCWSNSVRNHVKNRSLDLYQVCGFFASFCPE